MRARALAVVLLRVWAITTAVQVVMAIPQMVAFVSPQSAPSVDASLFKFAGTSQIAASLIFAVVAVVLFRSAERVAAYIVGEEDVELGDLAALQAVAFGTLGAYFLVLGLRQIAGLVFEVVTRPQYETEQLAYLWRNVPLNLVQAAVQTVCGFVLLAGRNGVSRLVDTVRGKAVEEEPPAGPSV